MQAGCCQAGEGGGTSIALGMAENWGGCGDRAGKLLLLQVGIQIQTGEAK